MIFVEHEVRFAHRRYSTYTDYIQYIYNHRTFNTFQIAFLWLRWIECDTHSLDCPLAEDVFLPRRVTQNTYTVTWTGDESKPQAWML